MTCTSADLPKVNAKFSYNPSNNVGVFGVTRGGMGDRREHGMYSSS